MEKTCKKCSQVKPFADFPKLKSSADGLYSYCRVCSAKKTKNSVAIPPRRTPPPGLKWCNCCKQDLPIADFHAMTGSYDGLQRRCRNCSATKSEKWRKENLTKAAYLAKKFRERHPTRTRDYAIKQNYGLELGSYDRMLAEQDGKCAICTTDTPGGRGSFHVDHCHTTGQVRGLLCHGCNVGIGLFKHDREKLSNAIKYLEKFPTGS